MDFYVVKTEDTANQLLEFINSFKLWMKKPLKLKDNKGYAILRIPDNQLKEFVSNVENRKQLIDQYGIEIKILSVQDIDYEPEEIME